MSHTTRTDEGLWFLVTQPLGECVKRWRDLSYNTLKGKRAYWREKVLKSVEAGKMEVSRIGREAYAQQKAEQEIDPNAEKAIEFLSPSPSDNHDLLELYANAKDAPTEISIETPKDSVKVLYLNEL